MSNGIKIKLAAAIFTVALSGCASVPDWKAGGSDWTLSSNPIAEIDYVYAEPSVIKLLCESFTATEGTNIKACATRTQTVCRIYLPRNAPDWIKAHEEKHCAGWNHKGNGYALM